jgi:hypothetical protein
MRGKFGRYLGDRFGCGKMLRHIRAEVSQAPRIYLSFDMSRYATRAGSVLKVQQ